MLFFFLGNWVGLIFAGPNPKFMRNMKWVKWQAFLFLWTCKPYAWNIPCWPSKSVFLGMIFCCFCLAWIGIHIFVVCMKELQDTEQHTNMWLKNVVLCIWNLQKYILSLNFQNLLSLSLVWGIWRAHFWFFWIFVHLYP